MRLASSFFLLIAFFTTAAQQNPSSLRLSATQKTKGGSMPLYGATIELIINDTLKITRSTDAEGRMEQIDVPPSRYKIVARYADCNQVTFNDVIVSEGKPTYCAFSFLCPSFIKTLSKKEKKKLGIK